MKPPERPGEILVHGFTSIIHPSEGCLSHGITLLCSRLQFSDVLEFAFQGCGKQENTRHYGYPF